MNVLDNVDALATCPMDEYPYYKDMWKGSHVVCKISGAVVEDAAQMKSLLVDIHTLMRHDVRPIIVHGGGPQITKKMNEAGEESEFIDGLRVTSDKGALATQRVLSHSINPSLVKWLRRSGISACGIHGESGGFISVEGRGDDLGFVGEITDIDISKVREHCSLGKVPVISTMGRDKHDYLHNINADTAAAKIASKIEADKIFYFTDVAGLYANHADPSTLISSIDMGSVERKIIDGSISGGMIPKLLSCLDALQHGVDKAHIVSGQYPNAILLEMFTSDGVGTMITR